MLNKTLKLLADVPRCQYVSDDTTVYDEAELQQLARVLRPLLHSPSKLRRFLQDQGITITPSDFYSEIPTIRDLEASATERAQVRYDECFDADVMKAHLAELTPFGAEFDPPTDADPESGIYYWNAPMFSFCDAMAYYATVRLIQPRNIIEIGSGFSTLVALEALKKNDTEGHVTCIEPFPRQFISDHPDITLNQSSAQDITAEYLNDILQDGDILFIDSTHTVKHGSDCVHIYLKLLPAIDKDIMVHVHDIYLPAPMPLSMARDRQLYWTEQYLLAAYLTDNSRTKMLYGSCYNRAQSPQMLTNLMHGKHKVGGASVWFQQNARR